MLASCSQLRNDGLALRQRLGKKILLPYGFMYLFTEILIINIVSAQEVAMGEQRRRAIDQAA